MLLHRLDSTDPSYAELLEKGFLYEDDADVYLERHSRAFREAKGYLMDATSLHIFVLTMRATQDVFTARHSPLLPIRKG